MFNRIARLTVHRPKSVLAASFVLLLLSAVVGVGVFGSLKNGGFEDPSAESTRADQLLEENFGTGSPNVIVLVTADDGLTADSPEVAAAGRELTAAIAALAEVDTDDTASYWSLNNAPPLRSADGTNALILARVLGDDDQQRDGFVAIEHAVDDWLERSETTSVSIAYGGAVPTFTEIGETIEGDLTRAEAIAVPLTLLLLLFVFGGLLASLLPLAVGAMAVFGAFGTLWILTTFTDVSIFSINLVTALGLGLAIDYSLFIVSRFREELGAGRGVDEAVVRTVQTAGRTVAFSAVTVAVSLAALLIFPLYFLRSFAYAGIGVILVALVASVITLPAILKLLGTRLAPKKPVVVANAADNMWGRLATWVMRRPVVVAGTITVVLIAVGIPFLGVQFGVPDDRVLPEDATTRTVADVIRTDFDGNEGDALPVVATLSSSTTAIDDSAIDTYARELSLVDGVARVDSINGRWAGGEQIAPADPSLARFSNGTDTWFNVLPNVEAISPEAEAMVADLRAIDAPFDAVVGGQSALLVDSKAAIFGLVPWAAALIAVATFVLLFLMFGSILVPLKAIILNTLSLTATFGLMVWVFQDGNGAGLLDFTATGLTDTTTPILMFCIAFGLSMDYEVFLLSRIKEEYDRTGDNDEAVATGLARTGRIVTAAALLLSITFFAFATSGVTFIKLFGLGLGVAVLVDAFIIRATLVPALMTMAGSANWWAPTWMRRIHDRFGISEGGADDAEPGVIDMRTPVSTGDSPSAQPSPTAQTTQQEAHPPLERNTTHEPRHLPDPDRPDGTDDHPPVPAHSG